MGVILETGPDEYRRTGLSTSLSSERYSDGYPCMCAALRSPPYLDERTRPLLTPSSNCRTACITAGILALPAQLKKTNYQTPSNGTDCAFQLGFNTPLHFFEFLKEHPQAAVQFNNHMSAYRQGRPSWMDPGFYDVPGMINADIIRDQDALLVDMGGSVGHDLSEFRRKWSDAPGRLVLQDLPEVLAQAKTMSLHPSIELMEHDFFTEQPVKGNSEAISL